MAAQPTAMIVAGQVRRPWLEGGARRMAPMIAALFAAVFFVSWAVAGSASNRALLEQKVKLLEKYFASATVTRIETGNDSNARATLERAKGVFSAARTALEVGDLERAADGFDEALRQVTSAVGLVTRLKRRRSAAQEIAHYERLRGQIRSYLSALRHGSKSSTDDTAAKRVHARLVERLTRAEEIARAGAFDQAMNILSEAYRVAVIAITAQRRGETAVFRLSFETPADEYDYERNRNESYEMLVEIMMSERGSASAGLRAMVERLVTTSRRLRAEARASAEARDYAAGIAMLEDATHHLIRALRAGGLPVPE